jgi:MerR family transcriptional regulator, copper efflux regulator
VRVPIACSLPPGEARSQIGQWKQIRRSAARVERVAPHRLDLVLSPEADIAFVALLAQKEKACCPFFTFKIEIWADHLALVVEVPDDAIEVLEQLAPDPTEAIDPAVS